MNPGNNGPTTRLSIRIENRSARIAVVGLGYVGLPLSVAFAHRGFSVTGIDIDTHRVDELNAGRSYIRDVPSSTLRSPADPQALHATSDFTELEQADIVVICVPTPLDGTDAPDMRAVTEVATRIAKYQHDDMLVVLESTAYPGATQELLVPALTRPPFAVGHSVFIAFAPERLDPGNSTFSIENTPKIIGGVTTQCLNHAQLLYAQITETLVPVSSPRTAEMVKLLENTFRAVNIALVNELAISSACLGIDIHEVIEAASTKPFGYMPFFPGPGVGGHCIPVDPQFLAWKLATLQESSTLIETAKRINRSMPGRVVQRAAELLEPHRQEDQPIRILVIGIAYKADVNDTRHSPALPILEGLTQRGFHVAYTDTVVTYSSSAYRHFERVKPDSNYERYDLVILLTAHACLNRCELARGASRILDTRGLLRNFSEKTKSLHSL